MIMDYKLAICEACENIVSLEDNKKEIFICPLCGTLNERTSTKLYEGEITALSPVMQCEMELDTNKQSGTLMIESLDKDLQDALQTLISFGWKLKFKTRKIN
jgi:hypothetical protein